MGVFARKALQEVKHFGQKSVLGSAQQFGRKITSLAQQRGDQIHGISQHVVKHADLAGYSGVANTARAIGHGAKEISGIAKMLDANQPRGAVQRALNLVGV
jgi:hypothetical protein